MNPSELEKREQKFVLDCVAVSSVARGYEHARPRLWSVLPQYDARNDPHAERYTTIPVVQKFLNRTGTKEQHSAAAQKSLYLRNTTGADCDGKLYDAYVAYPWLFGGVASGEAEKFTLHTLPQVLEGRCGYKLFIFSRDSPPGEAVVDVVEESMQANRRLLLLYSASTFSSGSDGEEAGQERYEQEAAIYRALQEGSLQVVLEEVSPAQLALFPQSVRHLRERQGAVCLWKSKWTRGRPGDEVEMSLGVPSLSPSSWFWRELRYHMPVRAKRVTS